jgi:hypothetical protein
MDQDKGEVNETTPQGVDHLKRLVLVVIRHSNLADCGVRGRRGRVGTTLQETMGFGEQN